MNDMLGGPAMLPNLHHHQLYLGPWPLLLHLLIRPRYYITFFHFSFELHDIEIELSTLTDVPDSRSVVQSSNNTNSILIPFSQLPPPPTVGRDRAVSGLGDRGVIYPGFFFKGCVIRLLYCSRDFFFFHFEDGQDL
jgi:hypothetical protein